MKPIILVAVHTGMRRGEILSLRWDNVDSRHNLILLKNTKTDERREIPINTTLEELFNNIPRRSDCDYVFNKNNGKPYVNIKRSFQDAVNKAGLDDVVFHTLRHSFASNLAMQGIDLTTVKELLGHHDIKMTLRYEHLAPGHKKRTVNIFDKAFRDSQLKDGVHNFKINLRRIIFQKAATLYIIILT